MTASSLITSFSRRVILGVVVPDGAHLPAHAAWKDLHPMKQGGAGRTARQLLSAEQRTDGLHLGGYFNRGLQERTLYNIHR